MKADTLMCRLKDMDLIGKPFSFKFDRRDILASKMGGCISIIVILVSLITGSIFVYDFLDWTYPDVVISTEKSEIFPKINLYDFQFSYMIAFLLQGTPTPPEEINNYLSVRAWISTVKLMNGTDIHTEKYEIPMKKCSEILSKNIFEKILTSDSLRAIFLDRSFCMDITEKDKDNYFVQNSILDIPYTYMTIGIFPCDIISNPNCDSNNPNVDFLELIFGNLEYSFTPGNLLNPIKPISNSNLNFKMQRSNQIYGTIILKRNEIADSKFDFFNPRTRFSFIDVESRKITSRARDPTQSTCVKISDPILSAVSNCTSIFEMTIKSGGTKKIVQRNYRKLLDTLGDIGGVFELNLIFGALLFCCCQASFYRSKLKSLYFQDSHKEVEALYNKQGAKKVRKEINKMIKDQNEVDTIVGSLGVAQVLSDAILEPHHIILTPLILLLKAERRADSKEVQNSRVFKKEGKSEASTNKDSALKDAFRRLEVEMRDRQGIHKKIDTYFYSQLKQLIDGSTNSTAQFSPNANILNSGSETPLIIDSVSTPQDLSTPEANIRPRRISKIYKNKVVPRKKGHRKKSTRQRRKTTNKIDDLF